jgi:benzoyl-CoA reductase/2-hydroxyglutaryl-CoA dehydratase subunit BcrC/BadD/HgdB
MLPPVFREMLETPLHAWVPEVRAAGNRILGTTCSYIPRPLVAVQGLLPVRLRAPGLSGTPLADTYLSSVLCSYTRSLLEAALDGTFDLLDGWVFTASCDHLRRLCDNLEYLQAPPFLHILDLPHKMGEEALAWYVEELDRLARALADRFGVNTGPEALADSIRKQNEYLRLLQRIGDLRRREHPPISGSDFHRILVAGEAGPRDRLLPAVRELGLELERTTEGIRDYRARILVAGSQLDDPGYIQMLESMGALVVADRFCLGSIPGLEPIPEQGDPLRELAAHTLRKISCPRMMEAFDLRAGEIVNTAKRFNVHGVVLEIMKFCDLWGVESGPLVSALRKAGLPVLRLEREYALSGEGQARTRIQAFLESMGR